MRTSLASPQDLLSNPIAESPLLRESGKDRAQLAGGSASFAHKLRTKTQQDRPETERAESKLESGDSAAADTRTSEESADVDTEDSQASETPTSETDNTSETAVNQADQDGEQATAESATSEQAVQTQAANHDVEVEVKTHPETIHALNTLLLQGQATAKFALVAANLRPEAIRGSRTGAKAEGKSEPGSLSELQAASGPNESDATSQKPLAAETAASASTSAAADSREKNAHSVTPADAKQEGQAAPAQASAAIAGQRATPAEIQLSSPTVAAHTATPAADTVKPVASQPTVGASSGNLLDRLTPATSGKASAAPVAGQEQTNQAFASQLQRGLAAALNQKTGAVTIRLNPESLGQLKIQVRVNEGAVTAAIEVSSTKTRDLLNKSLASLHDMLQDKGLAVGEVKVSVATPMPQRDFGLPPAHQQPMQDQNVSAWTGDAGQHSGQQSGHNANSQTSGNAHQSATPADASADLAVTLSMVSPDSVVGRAQYVALPDGRLGVIALA